MFENCEEQDLKDIQETHAVYRLLEVAEKKSLIEDNWQEVQKNQCLRSSKQSESVENRKPSRKKLLAKQQSWVSHKSMDKQRLAQLMKQSDIQQVAPKQPKKINPEKEQQDLAMTMRFLRNAKLRPFNSNLTFYSTRKDNKERAHQSSMNFYQKELKSKNKQRLSHDSFRVIKSREPRFSDRYIDRTQSHNNIVYFKPNKSETVRELLNQMKEERTKNKDLVLNATNRGPLNSEQLDPEINMFSQHQVRVIKRYKRFVPFQKDEHLIYGKLIDGENIWLKKYKESWLKQKRNMQNKKPNFKKLIINQ